MMHRRSLDGFFFFSHAQLLAPRLGALEIGADGDESSGGDTDVGETPDARAGLLIARARRLLAEADDAADAAALGALQADIATLLARRGRDLDGATQAQLKMAQQQAATLRDSDKDLRVQLQSARNAHTQLSSAFDEAKKKEIFRK